jgi:hypothetical protein
MLNCSIGADVRHGGSMVSPVLTRENALEVYTLAGSGATQANTISAGTGTNVSNVEIAGSQTATSTQVTAGDTVSTTNNGGVTSTQTSNNPAINNTTTTTTNPNQVISTTQTGTTTTTQTVNNPATTTTSGTTTGATVGTTTVVTNPSTNTQTTTNPNVTTTTNGTNSGTENTTGSSTNNQTTAQDSSTDTTQEQVIEEGFSEQTKGHREAADAALQYEGLGTYQVLSVPKSDASLLMSLTRNYFILNEIDVTTPQDPSADAIVYVTVDIFGTDRKRTDVILYNNERLSAETAIEMFAADRSGKIIMRPTVGNVRTDYREDYILWAGPLVTKREVGKGAGLLDDFTDQ